MKEEKIRHTEQVVIVGMGGGGLVAAIELVRRGKKVVIFENRDYFVRPQWAHLDEGSNKYIQSLIDPNDPLDDKFRTDQNARSVKTSRIRTLQKFLFRKLQALQKQYPDLIEIKRGKQFTITAIDPINQTLNYEEQGENKKIDFVHLLEADGAHHSMADLLNKSAREAGKEPYFEFQLQEVQPRHPPCGVIQCKLNLPPEVEDNEITASLIKDFFSFSAPGWKLDDCQALRNVGWNSPYFPMTTVYGKYKEYKINLGTEIPEYLYELSKDKQKWSLFQQKFLEWARIILFNNIEKLKKSPAQNLSEEQKKLLSYLTPECLVILPKELKAGRTEEYVADIRKLNTTAFLLQFSGANKACVVLGDQGTFTMIGDSFQTPYFFRFHGLNEAIQAAQGYSQALVSNNITDLPKSMNEMMQEFRTREFNSFYSDVVRSRAIEKELKTSFNVFYDFVMRCNKQLHDQLGIDQKTISELDSLISSIDSEIDLSSMDQLIKLRDTAMQITNKLHPFSSNINWVYDPFENHLRDFIFNNFPQQKQEHLLKEDAGQSGGSTKNMIITGDIYHSQDKKEKNDNDHPGQSSTSKL